MANSNRSYLEHVALYVQDLQWYIRFFEDAFGMIIRKTREKDGAVSQVWLNGGIQLIAEPVGESGNGRMNHLGFMVENLENTIAAVKQYGAVETPKGPNWFRLRDGLVIELIQAAGTSVADMLNIDPRA